MNQALLDCCPGECDHSQMRTAPDSGPPREVVAGRYELSRRIARGGMGEVFAALDRSSGNAVALKRLRASGIEQSSARVHFKREYHALSELQHPRIIRVYDYGVDRDTPYYTMELLDGQDLRDLSPVPYREACSYLRDVASSLALLHARRLLHRDLSPRNVRRTADGHCKLLDFGAMIPFGLPPDLVGTAPCIPPEALQGGNLDGRSDLYSLGALAYCLLTGRHAHDVTKVEDLADAWEKPFKRPKQRVLDVPEALDELVMSLLSIDPMMRPRSAAEVIDWLSALGELPPDDSAAHARSFLTSSQLCGRDEQRAELSRRARRSAEGTGCALSIDGCVGSGKSRMLAEAALIAQTCGLTVARAAARSQPGAGHALMQDLLNTLAHVAPLEAERAGVSRVVWPTLPRSASAAPTHERGALATRAGMQEQLSAIFCSVARVRPLLLVIDAVERADEFSLAVLASLAHQASELPLMIVWATAQGQPAPHPDTAAALERAATHLHLDELTRAQSDALLASMFGDVPNLSRLAEWMYGAAQGNPKRTLALAEQLLRRGLLRYADGTWVLPGDELRETLPQDIDEAWSQRLAGLSAAGLALAELLSVRRAGASAVLCLAAAGTLEASVFLGLEELVREGVLESAGQDYVFAQDALRETLLRRLSPERSRELHGCWGAALLARATQDVDTQLEAGWHLVHTDDELRGAKLLARVGPLLVEQGLAMAEATPAIEKALAVYEKHAMPLHARAHLRSTLVLAGYLFDHRLAQRYGEQTLALLQQVSGVALAGRLQRWLGGSLGLLVALAWTELRRIWTPRAHRAPPVFKALQYFVRSALGLLGVRALALDAAGTQAIVRQLAPLAAAPGASSGRTAYLSGLAFAMQMLGRESDVAVALDNALRELRAHKRRDITPFEYQSLLVGLAFADGINECYRAGSQALLRADQLEQMGTGLARAAAERIRMTYHLLRADRDRAEQSRRAIELHGIQGGTTWQVEWFAVPLEGMAGVLWTDLVLLRGSLDKLEGYVHDMPSLAPHRDVIRIAYHFRRGEFARAAELGERFTAAYAPRQLIAWGFGYGLSALALVEVGEHERARQLCELALGQLPAADRVYFPMYSTLEVAHATALALLGERARADEIWRACFERLQQGAEHANLVALYEHQARMARLLGDKRLLAASLQAMRDAALASGLPALILLADRAAKLRAKLRSSPLPPGAGEAPTTPTAELPAATGAENAATIFLRRYKTAGERKRQALRMLAGWFASNEAYLYADDAETPQLLAAASDREAPSELAALVHNALAGPCDSGALACEMLAVDPHTGQPASKRFRIVRIPDERAKHSWLGAVAFCDAGDSTDTLPDALIADLGRLLAKDAR
jgi:hypothetical protein